MTERWLPVVGAESFYDVSDRGRIRSKHKIGRPARNGILQQAKNKKGYARVRLSIGTHDFSRVVHRLVLEAFVGPAPSEIHECNHKNGIKDDNRAENLEWVTPVENNRHSVENGFWHPHKGEAHGRAILTEKDVRRIRTQQGKCTQRHLADKYGVTPQTIASVWKRRIWKHVK